MATSADETLPLVEEQGNGGPHSPPPASTNRNIFHKWGDDLKEAAKKLKREILTLYLAWSDSRTPLYAKLLAAVILGYVLSPIDLIPDFIPVIGVLDDLILIPAGLWLLCRVIPDDIMEDSRNKARVMEARGERAPISWWGAIVVVVIWVIGLFWVFILLRKLLVHPSKY